MKPLTLFFALTICAASAFSTVQVIISGTRPGEIYFSGLHPTVWGISALYYSTDYGENIELRNYSSSPYFDSYGSLLADAADSSLYRVAYDESLAAYFSFTDDGGFNWNTMNDTVTKAYASGIIPGEVYRQMELPPYYNKLERSESYGVEYVPCSCIGISDTTWIYSAALGVDSGEVYIWGSYGNLYYSDDFAEYFTFLGDLYTTWGVSPWAKIINGAEPGEVFIYHDDSKIIWRVYDYGVGVDLIADFPSLYDFWYGGIAASREPGELYFLALEYDLYPGGTMQVHHTTNYGQDWTLFEHYIPWNGIISGQPNMPSNMHLQVWPNPANPSFTIEYNLPTAQVVELGIFNISGRKVWQYQTGLQLPGKYQITLSGEHFPSGTYILALQSGESRMVKTVIVLQ